MAICFFVFETRTKADCHAPFLCIRSMRGLNNGASQGQEASSSRGVQRRGDLPFYAREPDKGRLPCPFFVN